MQIDAMDISMQLWMWVSDIFLNISRWYPLMNVGEWYLFDISAVDIRLCMWVRDIYLILSVDIHLWMRMSDIYLIWAVDIHLWMWVSDIYLIIAVDIHLWFKRCFGLSLDHMDRQLWK